MPARAGVTVIARRKETLSMTMTEIAMEPTKSPAGPGNSAMGTKASTVVAVEARSGPRRRRTASVTASTRLSPASRRRRTSSVMTMAASTSRPSATISPVTDI